MIHWMFMKCCVRGGRGVTGPGQVAATYILYGIIFCLVSCVWVRSGQCLSSGHQAFPSTNILISSAWLGKTRLTKSRHQYKSAGMIKHRSSGSVSIERHFWLISLILIHLRKKLILIFVFDCVFGMSKTGLISNRITPLPRIINYS